jgi:Transposase DDE domain group 1
VLDLDSTEVRVHGRQEHSAYNGHFESTCYHPLLLFNREGDCLAAKLRPGNVHSADGWEELLLPEIERQQTQGKEVVFRGDAAFAKPELYEALEERDVKYAIRLPANDHRQRNTTELLTRPVGRPSQKPVFRFKSFLYQAASWTMARRVVAKVEFHCGALFPRAGFIVTNLATSSRAVVRFYNKRGTAEQWIKESKQAVSMTRLSCHRFRANEVRLWLSVIAYNLGAAAGAADSGRHLVADQLAAAVGEDRRTVDKARTLLLVAASGESPDAPAVCRHAAKDHAAACAGGIRRGAERSKFR